MGAVGAEGAVGGHRVQRRGCRGDGAHLVVEQDELDGLAAQLDRLGGLQAALGGLGVHRTHVCVQPVEERLQKQGAAADEGEGGVEA